MDIEYLLKLQNFREKTNNFFTPLMEGLSLICVSGGLFIALCVLFWVIDKKLGKLILVNFCTSVFLNAVLKLIFCIRRPWIRDGRIKPVKGALPGATGYSFPSGHTTTASAVYGTIAVDQYKKRTVISVILVCMIVLTGLSRNYLGVHTGWDVICAIMTSVFVIAGVAWLGEACEKRKNLDIVIVFIGMMLASLSIIYIQDRDYTLRFGAYSSIGRFAGCIAGWFIERRYIKFEIPRGVKNKFFVAILASLGLLLIEFSKKAIKNCLGAIPGSVVQAFFMMIYVFAIVPFLIKLHNSYSTRVNNIK